MNKNNLTPAATVLLFKNSAAGPKVFMVKRSKKPPFENLYVFPGGKVDQDDGSSKMYDLCKGLNDEKASSQLNIGSGGLAYWVAAIRESFEEVGILMADLSDKQLGAGDSYNKKLKGYRDSINNGELTFYEMLVRESLDISLDSISPLSHWITPEIEKRRFNTRFFVAEIPNFQTGEHDGRETTDSVWITPEDALKKAESGDMQMIMPTTKNLESCCGFNSVEELINVKKNIEPTDRPSILPKFFKKNGNWVGLLPGDDGYEQA
jgi:8-oxo-dGTP pyrophosphatase MutT (NUDIX family)